MVSGGFRSVVPTLLLGKGEYLIQEAFILLATMALVLKHVTQADPPMGAHLCGGDDPLVEQFDEERSRDIEQRRGFISGQFLVYGNQGHILALGEQCDEDVKCPDDKVWKVLLLTIGRGEHDHVLGPITVMLAQKGV